VIPGLIAVVLLAAPEPPASPASSGVRAELKPFEFLLGSCWTGTFPNGTSTDTHCFEPVYGGLFVRDRHVVRGAKTPYEGESIHAWDATQKKLVFTYWASNGAVSTGTAEPQASGEIVFPEAHSGGASIKSVWTPRGPDAYDVWVAEMKDGQWREQWRMTMRRDAPAE
jgi:hypothetical protein